MKQEGEEKAPHRTPEGSAKSTSQESARAVVGGAGWGGAGWAVREPSPELPGRGQSQLSVLERGAGVSWSGELPLPTSVPSLWSVPELFKTSFGFWGFGP